MDMMNLLQRTYCNTPYPFPYRLSMLWKTIVRRLTVAIQVPAVPQLSDSQPFSVRKLCQYWGKEENRAQNGLERGKPRPLYFELKGAHDHFGSRKWGSDHRTSLWSSWWNYFGLCQWLHGCIKFAFFQAFFQRSLCMCPLNAENVWISGKCGFRLALMRVAHLACHSILDLDTVGWGKLQRFAKRLALSRVRQIKTKQP